MNHPGDRHAGTLFLLIPVIVLLLIGSGCSHSVLVKPNSPEKITDAKIEADVGLYLTSTFKTYKASESRGGDTWNYDNLGEASAVQFQQALAQIFRTVELVQEKPPVSNPKIAQPSLILEPAIEGFDFDIPLTKFQVYPARITYKVTVYDPKGKVIVTREAQGIGDTRGSPGFDFAANPSKAASKAVDEGCKKALEALLAADEIKAVFSK